MAETTEIMIGNASGQHVAIRPLWRCHPNAANHDDANWIESDIRVTAGRFRGGFRASLRSQDFHRFQAELKSLTETLGGKALFDTMEGQIEIELDGDGKGHVLVKGKMLDEAGIGNTLSFAFEIDQTYLPAIASAVSDVLRKFPVVDRPDA